MVRFVRIRRSIERSCIDDRDHSHRSSPR